MHKSKINIEVELNEQKVPEKINWSSSDGNANTKMMECKAMLLSLFDKDSSDTLKIDLWTTEMQVIEMDRFMYQSLRALADTYFKATQNKELAEDMQKFVQYFGEKIEIISPKNS